MSGARRKEQRWDPKENEQVVPEDRETHKKIERDAMYRLEHGSDDKNKLKNAIPGIKQIQALQMEKKDDYLLNKLARQKFRVSPSPSEFFAVLELLVGSVVISVDKGLFVPETEEFVASFSYSVF